jgi:hypothetical protein
MSKRVVRKTDEAKVGHAYSYDRFRAVMSVGCNNGSPCGWIAHKFPNGPFYIITSGNLDKSIAEDKSKDNDIPDSMKRGYDKVYLYKREGPTLTKQDVLTAIGARDKDQTKTSDGWMFCAFKFTQS